jgi:hypothetical protein
MTATERAQAIADIAAVPEKLRDAVDGLTGDQLDTPYRPEGWTVRQVVHHLADSHLNAFTRFRLALTEDRPAIKPYDEKLWAELYDAKALPLAPSMAMMAGMHERWVALLRQGCREEDFGRKFVHPEHGERTVDWLLYLYAWHGKHHVAHITGLRERMGWK